MNWDSYAVPKRNVINISKNRRQFKRQIENKTEMIRIALHPRDPVHALNGQKEMIFQLKEPGYQMLKYTEFTSKLETMPTHDIRIR